MDVEELAARLEAMSAKLARLEEQAAIREVMRRYVRGLDRHDVDLEASAFWPDAQVNYGFYSGERDAFVAWGNATHAANYARHEHHVTNQSIEIDGDTAHVESYVIYFLCAKDETTTQIGGARYIDRMERRDGEWRIAVREFVPDILVEGRSLYRGAFIEAMCPASGQGTWDRNDLSYARPLPRRAGSATGQDVILVPQLGSPSS